MRAGSGAAGFCLSLLLLAAVAPLCARGQFRAPVPGARVVPRPPSAPALVEMRYEDGYVTAQLREAPLPRVLEEVAARTGVIFEVGIHDVTPISLSLYRVPLAEAIERIVGGANNSIVYFEPDAAGGSRISFVRIIPRKNRPPAPSLRYIGTGEITKSGDDTIETPEQALKALAQGQSLDARLKAIEVLAAAKGEVATQALAAEISDPEPEIRAAAIEGLAGLEAQSTLPQIVKALKDNHPGVRQRAVDAVALLGDAQNLKDVRPLARDPDPNVAAAAENAMRKLSVRRP